MEHQQENEPLMEKKDKNQRSENYHAQLTVAEQLIDHSEEAHEDHTDYSELEKSEILKKAEELIYSPDVRKAQETMNRLRDAMDAKILAERPEQIKAWVDEGNDARDFKPAPDEAKKALNSVFQKFKERREEERKRAEEEKLANLKKKQAVLEDIRELAESEEQANSLNKMRDLMKMWREIRQVPKEFQDELYTRYKFYVDKFYDNLSLYNELKELDREKNLEFKIELIKKTEALGEEKDIRKALNTLNKIHEDWRNAGPVRREISDELWHRFKNVSDVIIQRNKERQEELDRKRQENLNIKQLLVEKSEAAIAVWPTAGKDWSSLGKELDTLLEQWKKTGAVPVQKNQEIWDRFSSARQQFFAARREFFKNINAGREENLKRKIELCEKAEALINNEQFQETSDKLNELQEQWKKTGPVPEAKNDEVWKRFRAAFDHFYARKNAWLKQRREDDKIGIAVKEAIIADMKKLLEIENADSVFPKLKECQQRWAGSGFVSGKAYFNLQKEYREIGDVLFAKFKRNSDNMKQQVMKEHYAGVAGRSDGKNQLQSEERKVKDRIKKAQEELATIENNKSFFALSKNAEAVLKQFDTNIQKLQEQIARLEKELAVIRNTKPGNAQ
ncbi:MAG: DUF349 domain-containing protein [Sphingomonadales bacterium]